MAFPASKRRHLTQDETTLNIVPVLNLFSTLIPFLLLCAVFASTAVLQLSLPEAAEGGNEENLTEQEKKTEKETLNLSVVITDKGFTIAGTGAVLPSIPKVGGKYNLDELKKQLKKVKEKFPFQEDVILVCEQDIIYDLIIQVMDIAIEAGLPNIALSGRIQ
jgi:biopolymer transport protein ExbD